ncbi:Tyrosine-protein kinase [Caenorhabditis elegans]|uniref:Tyrosine-protein kinase n=1 Tax=Caenorhabditis elegans TaxID=6239 RepID=Q9XW34_CAEEL|nr:Tyrosine-protein kinase [Caenorhabditis elegans]CAA22261.2 Tyrosine-protein kinase [Caenorhabditis elegans]|eukprot:NP_502040.2 Tyrosine-protein kinase [Caenorhabditis elegans]
MNSIKSEHESDDDLALECVRLNDAPSDIEASDKNPNEPGADKLESGNKNVSTSMMSNSSSRDDPEEDYIRSHLINLHVYHGVLFGSEAEKLLTWDRAYLVRRAITKPNKFLCISVNWKNKIFHYQLDFNEDGWCCKKLYEKFPTMPNRRFLHIRQLLEAWSQATPFLIPTPRGSNVLIHSTINLDKKLGCGAFGEVFKGQYKAVGSTNPPIEVAVKRILGNAKRKQIQEFCNEAQIMTVLQHENIVAFYGFASLEEPIMVVMELVTGGDLRKYFQTTQNIPKLQILWFAMNVASGMRHLSSKGIIHRDLAARNCLVTQDLKAKISDFGLSLQGTVTTKNLEKAPIRWLAPESLKSGLFNEKTDVWSYGVFLTELMTRCEHDPLYPKSLKDAKAWILTEERPHKMKNGDPKELMVLIDACCERNPNERLNFNTVKRQITDIYMEALNKGPQDGRKPENSAMTVLTSKPSEDRTRISLNRKKSVDRQKIPSSSKRSFFSSLRKKNKDQVTLPAGMSISPSTNSAKPPSSETPNTGSSSPNAPTPPPQAK